ncbi:unnamed protein product [Blepharisma stoltei]|uniref:DUF4378 domain-containing protein n=1 Tax=Blepharisma stoltei TaxID=1481888 RepID=A0AAU9J9J0_9CILI|nr:unnamed protein product [Blepharisma stoltei]
MKNQEDLLYVTENQFSPPKYILNVNTNGIHNNSTFVTGKKIKSLQTLATKKSLTKKPENLLKSKPQIRKSETNINLKGRNAISKETSPIKRSSSLKGISKRLASPPEPKISHEISPKPVRSKSAKRDRKIQPLQPKQPETEIIKEKPAPNGKIKKIIYETLAKNQLEKSINIKKEEETKKKEEEKKTKLKKTNEAIRKQNFKKAPKEKKLHKMAWGADQTKFENKEYVKNPEEAELREKKKAERERSLNERRANIGLDLYPNIKPRRKSPKIEADKIKEPHWSPDPNVQKYMQLKKKEIKIAELQTRLEELVKEKERERALEMVEKQRKSAFKKTKKKKKKKEGNSRINELSSSNLKTKKRLLVDPLSQSQYVSPLNRYKHERDMKKIENYKSNNLSGWKNQSDSELSDIAVHPYIQESLEEPTQDNREALMKKLKILQERVSETKKLLSVNKYTPDEAAIIIQRWYRNIYHRRRIEEITESYQSRSSEELGFSSSLLNSLFNKKQKLSIESFPNQEELSIPVKSQNTSKFSIERQETERDEEWIDFKDPPDSLKNSKSELVDQFRLTLQTRFSEIEQKFLDNEIMVQAQLDELGSIGENSAVRTGGTESSSRNPYEATPEASERDRVPIKIPLLPIGRISLKKSEESETSNGPYISVYEDYEEPIIEESSSSISQQDALSQEKDVTEETEERDHAASSDTEAFSPKIEWFLIDKPSSHRVQDFRIDEIPEPDNSEHFYKNSFENVSEAEEKTIEEVSDNDLHVTPMILDLRAMLDEQESDSNKEISPNVIKEQAKKIQIDKKVTEIKKENQSDLMSDSERNLQKKKLDSEIKQFISEKVPVQKFPIKIDQNIKPYKPEFIQNAYQDRIIKSFQEKQEDGEPKSNSAKRYGNFVKGQDSASSIDLKNSETQSNDSEEDLWVAGSNTYKIPQESPTPISDSSQDKINPFIGNTKLPQHNINPNSSFPKSTQENPKQALNLSKIPQENIKSFSKPSQENAKQNDIEERPMPIKNLPEGVMKILKESPRQFVNPKNEVKNIQERNEKSEIKDTQERNEKIETTSSQSIKIMQESPRQVVSNEIKILKESPRQIPANFNSDVKLPKESPRQTSSTFNKEVAKESPKQIVNALNNEAKILKEKSPRQIASTLSSEGKIPKESPRLISSVFSSEVKFLKESPRQYTNAQKNEQKLLKESPRQFINNFQVKAPQENPKQIFSTPVNPNKTTQEIQQSPNIPSENINPIPLSLKSTESNTPMSSSPKPPPESSKPSLLSPKLPQEISKSNLFSPKLPQEKINKFSNPVKVPQESPTLVASIASLSQESPKLVASIASLSIEKNNPTNGSEPKKENYNEKAEPIKKPMNKEILEEKKIPGLSDSDRSSSSNSNREMNSVPSLESLHEGNSSPLPLDTEDFDKDSSDDSDLDIMKRIRKHIEGNSPDQDRKFSPLFTKEEINQIDAEMNSESDNSSINIENNSADLIKDQTLSTSRSDDYTDELINQVIINEIDLYLQIIPFQEMSAQIDPNLAFIDEYLDVMLSQLLPAENDILDSINTPAYHDPLSRLNLLQNADIGTLVKYPTLDLILPPELCTELKSGFNSLDIPSRQIYLQMLFDCVNEALNYIRPYGTRGVPDPWSIRQRTLFGESQLVSVFERVKEYMYKWAYLRGGAYPSPDMIVQGGIDENKLQILREEKMSGLLCQDVQDEEINWLDYEEEEVQVKLDVADMVLELVIDETIKLLNDI